VFFLIGQFTFFASFFIGGEPVTVDEASAHAQAGGGFLKPRPAQRA